MEIELCAAGIEALEIASRLGFDRIELCQNLELGGLTPSIGLQQAALNYRSFETHVLIRCRAGAFCYNDAEKEVMLRDVFQSVKLGVHGLVVGALNASNDLDIDYLKEVQSISKKLPLTFHRAFDDLSNAPDALENLCSLGFKRILTSGQESSVDVGLAGLKSLVKQAAGRIQIMCGGGVHAGNVGRIVQELKPDAVHFSGTQLTQLGKGSLFEADVLLPNEAKIKAILDEIKAAGF